jgi:C-terminal processing protease CtpA/Prc
MIAILPYLSPSAGAQTDTVSVERRIAGLAYVWQEANYNFAFFQLRPGLDWDLEFEMSIGRVMATRSDHDYIQEVQRFVALLGEAHTNVEPGRAFRERHGGHPALELEEIQRKPVVVNSSRDLAVAIPIGSVITHVDGVPVAERLERDVFPYMSASTEQYLWRQSIRGHAWRAVGLLVGDVGSAVRLDIETPDDVKREVTVERLKPGAEIQWQNPPRITAPPLEFRELGNGVLYFALNTFNTPDVVTAFETHLADIDGASAVILDIRNNGGGNSSHGWNIGRYFSETPLEGSHWRTRRHVAAYKAWGKFSDKPDRKPYYEMNAWYEPEEFTVVDVPDRTFDVPLVILMGPSTYSAAEDFLAYMRAVPDVVFVGGKSAGSTGQPLTFQIPGGAWVGITSKHDTMPDGTEFVGVGVEPDIEVWQTIEAFRTGKDLVLDRALAALSDKTPSR